jgi:amino acid permease
VYEIHCVHAHPFSVQEELKAVACTLQVAQVLLTLPYSFAQLGFVSGVVFQIFYGVVGCWSCYMITSLYVEYRTRKEREGVIFKNHVIQVHCTFRLFYSNFIAADQTPSYICTTIRILAQFVEKI